VSLGLISSNNALHTFGSFVNLGTLNEAIVDILAMPSVCGAEFKKCLPGCERIRKFLEAMSLSDQQLRDRNKQEETQRDWRQYMFTVFGRFSLESPRCSGM
jgi:hypothetical protein